MGGRLRLLTTCFSIVEARICVSKLDAYGVYALAPLQFVTVHPHLMIMHGGVPVWFSNRTLKLLKHYLRRLKMTMRRMHPAAVYWKA